MGEEGAELPETLVALASDAEKIVEHVEERDDFYRVDVYVFFSFDLVGSTALKSYSWWPEAIRYFYTFCRQQVNDSELLEAQVWKYIGDEVLFYLATQDSNALRACVPKISTALEGIRAEMAERYFSKAPFLSVKATAWLAPIRSITSVEPSDEQKRILAELEKMPFGLDHSISDGKTRLDFLGPNIDAGFRISHFARQRQLVLSPALAYYLWFNETERDKMKIVCFEALKGVANGMIYPAIWHSEHWSNIMGSFSFIERETDQLIKAVCSKDYQDIAVVEEIAAHLMPLGYVFDPAILDSVLDGK